MICPIWLASETGRKFDLPGLVGDHSGYQEGDDGELGDDEGGPAAGGIQDVEENGQEVPQATIHELDYIG